MGIWPTKIGMVSHFRQKNYEVQYVYNIYIDLVYIIMYGIVRYIVHGVVWK
jgi:hypothetical protein